MRKIKISHNRERCIGCHACVLVAPQSWTIDPVDGKSNLIGAKKKGKLFVGEIYECDHDANLLAQEACPMKIIRLEK